MRGAYIRDAYVPKVGRVHIFHDTESTSHFYYLSVSSDRQGRVNRKNVVFLKSETKESNDNQS